MEESDCPAEGLGQSNRFKCNSFTQLDCPAEVQCPVALHRAKAGGEIRRELRGEGGEGLQGGALLHPELPPCLHTAPIMVCLHWRRGKPGVASVRFYRNTPRLPL